MRPDRGGVKPERSGRTTKCMVDLDTGPWYSIAEPGGGLRSYPVLELGNTVEGGAMTTKRVVTRAFILSALAVALLAGAAGALEVGQKAPDFSLPGPDGKAVKLSELTAKGPVVIYTFIAAFTPTLTKELAGFEVALPLF